MRREESIYEEDCLQNGSRGIGLGQEGARKSTPTSQALSTAGKHDILEYGAREQSIPAIEGYL